MSRRSLTLLATAAISAATPALAQERAGPVDVPSSSLDDAVRALSSQTGASIGFRDGRLSAIRIRGVRGRLTPAQALDRMLRDTGARARRVAPATFLIERAPAPPPTVRLASSLRQPAPPTAPPPETSGSEIVVTGTKRDIPLGAYPGGIEIIDGAGLSKADGARGTGAIEARLASVASTHLGQGRNKLFIRGIADSSFVGPTQATVGQYWGNSRITYSAPDPSLRLYDVRSVEVLEGPQGTLYGAGSLGGVVRVVPQAPDLDTAGGAAWVGVQQVQHGQPGADGGIVVNLPVVEDKLALRAVAFTGVEGGYIDDIGRKLKNVNDVRAFGGRLALRYSPDIDTSIDISAVGQRIDGDDSQYAERGGNGLTRSSSIAQPYRNDFWMADIVARKRWDDIELTSSLGYARQYVFEQFDGVTFTRTGDLVVLKSPQIDGSDIIFTDAGKVAFSPTAAALAAGLVQTNHIEMVTAETRLARRGPNGTGWLIGVSLLHNEAKVHRDMQQNVFNTALTGVRNRVQEATLYGEGTIEPIDRLTLTMGGRLTHSRLTGNSEDVDRLPAFDVDPSARAARRETRFLPSAALAWRANPATTLFARYQEGFRPGGIAVRRDFIQRFKGDRVATIEAGARHATRRLDLSLSASWTRWTNIQADLVDGYGFPTTANVGNGRILSIGATARWRPLPGLQLDASVYLNQSKVTERNALTPLVLPSLPADGADAPASGDLELSNGAVTGVGSSVAEISLDTFDRLPNIADVTGRVGFTYSARLGNRYDAQIRAFARYVGKSTLGVGPVLGQLQGNYLDTGLEMRAGDARKGVTLTLTNLLDSRGNRFALGSPFLVRDRNQITPLQPRTVRIGFDFAF